MTNQRSKLMSKRLLSLLHLPVAAAVAVSLSQSGCATSSVNQDAELTADGTETENIDMADLEGANSGEADSSDYFADAGDDAALTDQIAKEELSSDGSFDLDAAEAQPPAPVAADPLVADPAIDLAPVAEPTANEIAAPIAAPASEAVSITNLKYVSRKGGGTVVIETSAPATFHTREVPSQNQTVVEIENATLPAKFQRPFTTKDFNQSIASMNAYQETGSNTVRVVIQFSSPQKANVQQTGNVLTVASGGSGEMYAASGDDENLASDDGGSGNITRGAASDPRILVSSATDPSGYDNAKFYGRPISIEVRDTPVREVINAIAEQSGANIVLAGEVDGNISLKLRQVPWDQALLIVMKTRGLGYVRQGSILRVAPYESLQKEVDAAHKVAEAQKLAEPLRVKVIPVGYAKVDALEKQIQPFLSKDRGRVVPDIRTNALIVTDTTEVLARISNLVKAIDKPPLQVLIEGKIVEAREVFSREVGINWGWDGQPTDVGGGRNLGQNFRVGTGEIARGSTGATSALSLGTLDIFGELSATLRLFERENVVHVISSPRVVVLNNEPANIVQSKNIPITTSTISAGGTQNATTYQPIEMKLDVTPQVTSENDVLLNVQIKREFAVSTTNPPDINKREAKTKVLVRNGQTAVIGGVYQADSTESEGGVPWLRKLPVFGWLFKEKKTDNDKTEMLVFITPRILNAETAIQKENTL